MFWDLEAYLALFLLPRASSQEESALGHRMTVTLASTVTVKGSQNEGWACPQTGRGQGEVSDSSTRDSRTLSPFSSRIGPDPQAIAWTSKQSGKSWQILCLPQGPFSHPKPLCHGDRDSSDLHTPQSLWERPAPQITPHPTQTPPNSYSLKHARDCYLSKWSKLKDERPRWSF